MILCLLPVRNGGAALAEWLKAAPQWCDAVLALDDGSTDDTRAVLEAAPIVAEVLTHPARPTVAGWDDGANRAELLAAAARHRPDWILWLDADERLAPDDAAALRAFVAADALPGVAYGLRHCRMWGADAYDPRTPWVYRLFAWDPGHVLADEWLHFNPVPDQIPRRAWVRTSIRLQHFGAADEALMAARSRKYAEADPEGRFPTDFGDLDRVPVATVPWLAREPDAPVVLGPDAAHGPGADLDPAARATPDPDRPLVAALLPVRNGADDLDGWFRSIAAVADVVVALDDGSTDDTAARLAAHPLVVRLIERPVRPDHAGWDDAGNRQLLLDAAAELRPRWILFVDADERFAPDDAAALRAFVERDARPGHAYGFRVHRMIGDDGHFDRDELWVYRLFAWEPGLRLPTDRLHFVPVPQQVPSHQWLRTSIRLQHLGGSTPERRARRFRKYREADPHLEFQADYGHLLEGPGPLVAWRPRRPDEPVLLDAPPGAHAGPATGLDARADPEVDLALDLDTPILSAIVIGRNDREQILRTLESVTAQQMDDPFEVIAVVSGDDGGAAAIRERFPDVQLVDLGPGTAYPGRARNAGLALARGDYVSFPGSHTVVPPGSLAARVRAHELGYPMVTGSLLNANHTPAGWASYFLDHAPVLPGSPSGEMAFAPPHCSYDRELLLREGGFPEHLRAGEDTVVNTAMFRRGLRAYRASDVELYHASPCRDLPGLVGHHFRRGRGLGRIMVERVRPGERVLTAATLRHMALTYIPRRLRSTTGNVERYGDAAMQQQFHRVRRLVTAGVVAAWAGAWTELLRPAPGRLRALIGTPAVHVVLAGLDQADGFAPAATDAVLLARVDVLRGRVALLAPPRDLLVAVPDVGTARLNDAYAAGAAARGGEPRAGLLALAGTMRGLLGLRVDGVAVADFAGFVRLVDAVGGVEVHAAHAIDDVLAGPGGAPEPVHFPAGPQRLDGPAALAYARTSRADGDGWRRERHLQLATGLARAAAGRWRTARAAAATARTAVRTEGSSVRLAAAALGAWRAARRNAIRGVSLAAPAVRPVRLDDGTWAHQGNAAVMEQELRERFLG